MRVFLPETPDRAAVAVIGEGLLGRAVSHRLRERRWGTERHQPTQWDRPGTLAADVTTLLAPLDPIMPVDVVWSAGRGGMELDNFDAAAHRDHFRSELGSVLDACGRGDTRVHYMSSAGALGPPHGTDRFRVGDGPYAEWKALEESCGAEIAARWRVYRVSSVYGTPRGSSRSGVIGALVKNALLGRETPLFARTSTMRNYIHAIDVAEAVVRGIEQPGATDSELVAAPRSHAISEVLAEVERVVRRTVPVAFRPPANDHDMVFDPLTISSLVPQRSLGAGIRLVHEGVVGA
ncbi:MAG: NAD-dependent epimerase/dehydratase family protein [Acidimicrobiales bacterium]